MSSGFDAEYLPNPAKADIYQKLYEKYVKLGDFIENTY
jgi:L-ribulokinase